MMTDDFRRRIDTEDTPTSGDDAPKEVPETFVPPSSNEPPRPEGVAAGPLELLTDAVAAPRRAFRHLGRHLRPGLAFAVAILSSIALLATRSIVPVGDEFAVNPSLFLVSAVLGAAIGLPVVALMFHLTAWLLGGKNKYVFMLQATAFTLLPHLLAAPFYAVHRLVDISFVTGVIGFGTGIWTTVLSVIAIREVYNLSTGRAVAAVALPLVVFFVLTFVATFFALSALLASV